MSAAGPRQGDDAGVATVAAAGVIVVLVVLLGLVLALGSAAAARHRAEVVADLAALAGASEGVSGEAAGCARAGAIATAQGGRLEECVWAGWTVTVAVSLPCRCPGPVDGPVRGRARAGPAPP